MATPTQTQPFPGGNPYQGAGGPQAGPPAPQQASYGSEPRSYQSTPAGYGPSPAGYNFDKYCIIHIATTCDEHGVYVTKDSAEVIEFGWVVVDARDPNLPEVCPIKQCEKEFCFELEE